jgi:hypothetical protein
MVWALAQAVCGSLGPEGAATDLSALRVGLIGPDPTCKVDAPTAWPIFLQSSSVQELGTGVTVRHWFGTNGAQIFVVAGCEHHTLIHRTPFASLPICNPETESAGWH